MAARAPLALALAVLIAAPASATEISVAARPGALARAIETAEPGDILRLQPGVHEGNITVDTTLKIIGSREAEVRGADTGTVITIDAPKSVLKGFRVTGSGSSHETLDSGIKLTKRATGSRVQNMALGGNLHGIDIHGAADAIVAENEIIGRQDHRVNERGNGIYVWNAPGAVVTRNHVRYGRDGVFVNTSKRNTFSDNTFEDLRFAVHYMYADDGVVTGNVSRRNTIGYALMFSTGLEVRDNLSESDANHGLMLNYANKAIVENNVVRHGGEKCLFMYNANRNVVTGNRFEGCPIGIHFTAGSERNTITGNAFIANRIQVKYVGTKVHEWSAEGRGNFWSDHVSFDVNGDGIADQPFRPNDRIDSVLWTQPMARTMLGSPAIQLLRWVQRAFPSLLPGGVVDSAPLMQPVVATFSMERQAHD